MKNERNVGNLLFHGVIKQTRDKVTFNLTICVAYGGGQTVDVDMCVRGGGGGMSMGRRRVRSLKNLHFGEVSKVKFTQ